MENQKKVIVSGVYVWGGTFMELYDIYCDIARTQIKGEVNDFQRSAYLTQASPRTSCFIQFLRSIDSKCTNIFLNIV